MSHSRGSQLAGALFDPDLCFLDAPQMQTKSLSHICSQEVYFTWVHNGDITDVIPSLVRIHHPYIETNGGWNAYDCRMGL